MINTINITNADYTKLVKLNRVKYRVDYESSIYYIYEKKS